jgi:hypothetical protein
VFWCVRAVHCIHAALPLLIPPCCLQTIIRDANLNPITSTQNVNTLMVDDVAVDAVGNVYLCGR